MFVLCWCCESAKSQFVAKEIKAALKDSGKKLVPVLLCSTKLPEVFARIQWIDLRGKVKHKCELKSHVSKKGKVKPREHQPVIERPPLATWGGGESRELGGGEGIFSPRIKEISDAERIEAKLLASKVRAYFEK